MEIGRERQVPTAPTVPFEENSLLKPMKTLLDSKSVGIALPFALFRRISLSLLVRILSRRRRKQFGLKMPC